MSVRRSKGRSKRTNRRSRYIAELLEPRRLFNTIITDTDPLTPQPTISFEYKDFKGNDNARHGARGCLRRVHLRARHG